MAVFTSPDSTADTSIDSPSRTSTPRSRARLATGLALSSGWPNIARMPSRSAPIQPRPANSSTTAETQPVIVSTSGAGGLPASMTPSGCPASLTMPGSVLDTESTTLWKSDGCPRSTNPKTAKPRVSAGKIEKKAKNAMPPAIRPPRASVYRW